MLYSTEKKVNENAHWNLRVVYNTASLPCRSILLDIRSLVNSNIAMIGLVQDMMLLLMKHAVTVSVTEAA